MGGFRAKTSFFNRGNREESFYWEKSAAPLEDPLKTAISKGKRHSRPTHLYLVHGRRQRSRYTPTRRKKVLLFFSLSGAKTKA